MSKNEGYRKKFMEHVDGFITARKELADHEFTIRALLRNQGIDISHDDIQHISADELEEFGQRAFSVRTEEVKAR